MRFILEHWLVVGLIIMAEGSAVLLLILFIKATARARHRWDAWAPEQTRSRSQKSYSRIRTSNRKRP